MGRRDFLGTGAATLIGGLALDGTADRWPGRPDVRGVRVARTLPFGCRGGTALREGLSRAVAPVDADVVVVTTMGQ